MNLVAIAIADLIGFGLIMAMLYSSRVRRSEPKMEFKIFTVISLMSAVACLVDFLMFLSDGKDNLLCRIINIFGNTYCFITNPVFTLGWCMYIEFRLYNSFARAKRIYKYVAIPAILMVLVTFINLFIPIIFYIDENNIYHRLPFSYAYYVVEFGYIVYSIVVVRRYEARYGKLRFFPVYVMLGPAFLGCVIQALFYGVSTIWVSLSVGLTAIYMAMQNEFSYTDTLTGLFNRAYLDYLMEIYTKDSDSKLGGIMIDVDYFKEINDTFGHHVGDEALKDVARVIRLAKPDKAQAIRFAGDEFIILLKKSSEESIHQVIENIREELYVFNENEGRQYELSLSIGYTLYDAEKDNSDSFFKKMDDNMYEEKKLKHAER